MGFSWSRKSRPASQNEETHGGMPGHISADGYGITAPVPMMTWNNGITPTRNRNVPDDHDSLPRQFRRYVNASGVQDVQLKNGMAGGRLSGRIVPSMASGYLYAVRPIIPGQTRDNYGGYHVKGPSPLNMQQVWQNGPGSQPDNPGGPGKIAATHFVNPMTG